LTTNDLDRFKKQQQNRPNNERGEFKLVFDFTPDGKLNHSDSAHYGVCLDLARHIHYLRLQGVKTTAYVHGVVSGHSVLPVLACGSLVMSKDAKLGPVITDDATPLEEDERLTYRKFSAHRLSNVLVDKLYDRNLVVVAGKRGGFVAGDSPDAGTEPGDILFRSGTTAVYSFKLAAQAGLCDLRPIESRNELLDHLGLGRSSLTVHPLMLDKIVPGHIRLDGAVNRELDEDLRRHVKSATRDGVNLLILELRCGKGDTKTALDIADYLRGLKNRTDAPMMTVAYYTTDARDTALYLAMACEMFVLAPDATVGDFRDVLVGKSAAEIQQAAISLETLAEEQGYPKHLVRAMIDPNVKSLFLVSNGQARLVVTAEELDADRKQENPKWTPIKEIRKSGDGVLALNSNEAVEYKLADSKAEDLDTLYQSFGTNQSKVKDYGDDWVNDLKRFLCHPVTSFFLVMIGITCLILELKIPGATLPGVIAAICFVLFFWSHSQLSGQMIWLAILLFALGLILLGIELFILPGFGVCGISGLILVLAGLGIAAVDKWPETSSEWMEVGKSIGLVGLSVGAAVMSAMFLARFLPTVPIANRLFLTPEVDSAEGGQVAAFVSPELASMLGAIGVAATPLRPAGKVQFGDQFLDVVTESAYVNPGTRVQVIEIEGNRVVVKEV